VCCERAKVRTIDTGAGGEGGERQGGRIGGEDDAGEFGAQGEWGRMEGFVILMFTTGLGKG
jgi:hypothetical protein